MEAIQTMFLTKKYKDLTAVDQLNLSIKQGELFSLLGVNGSGKTTTIKMLSCLTKPTGGEAYVGGHSIEADALSVKRMIGVSPQETAVAQNLSVKENLELICGVHGFAKEKCQEKIKALSEQFHLDDMLTKKAGKLSGGWQRKLSLAMALISEPSIIFLDEPTLGLDVIARSELWDAIRALKGKVTIILTTHYMEEAAKADDIIIIDHGKVLTQGTPFELKERYAKDKVIFYYDDINGKRCEEILLDSTLDAIEIIQNRRDKIGGFEVIQGNMDDVFLNAVGKTLQEE